MNRLTARRARELLHYDAATGALTWAADRRKVKPGQGAGFLCKKSGYWKVRIDGVLYRTHRIAWLMTHGTWPQGEIDHINGDPADNCLANLRDTTRRQNAENLHKARSDNKTGVLGVCWIARLRKWKAHIQTEGKAVCLGHFQDKAEAIAARHAAEQTFFTHSPNRALSTQGEELCFQ